MDIQARWQRWRALVRSAADAWRIYAPAWLSSLTLHALIFTLLMLVAVGDRDPADLLTLILDSNKQDETEPLLESQELVTSEIPRPDVGSTGNGNPDAPLTAAPLVAAALVEPAELKVESAGVRETVERVTIQEDLRVATAPRFAETLTIRGAAGAGATGTMGAVDRITQEIMLSLDERRTLVVWFFDQSGSLERQRAEIVRRFDRIYEELGVLEAAGNPAFQKHEAKPLLSAVVAFGEHVSFLTPKPTDDVEEVKAAVTGLKTDESGIERTFQAVHQAASRYKPFRLQEPRRNVMFVIFTDEVGDDESELEAAVSICRQHAIPVYCVGVPAPFGRREAYVKYVDPDPKFDQSPQWIPVRQGPESFLPELVNIGSEFTDEPMDSGFGPYSLTRLCYETGGIYFAVHPSRDERRTLSRHETPLLSARLSHFFDPQVMLNYRPDYGSTKQYKKLLAENKARRALVEAAQTSWITPMERPQLVFPKLNDADLSNRLSQAQHAAAVLEPKIERLYQTLKSGEADRVRLAKPRWQAGYDLSMGRVLAVKVRTEGYNTMLAKAKQGMKFSEADSDTWQLAPANDLGGNAALEKLAEHGRMYLARVVSEHPGTPWALLAEKELKQPFGWTWKEGHTGVNAPKVAANNGNNAPRRPRNDRPNQIPRPERRPPPKL
ncbi:MAG TPA: vWA domain-containing protein [Pirellulales bacterium]|nr:vWA domain-containing protein [Pirellulales bacterium]